MNEKSIVVGVDGSPGSRAALEFAMAEAARRGTVLRVIAAVALPEYCATAYGAYIPPPTEEFVADVRAEVQRFVDEVVAARSDLATGLLITMQARAGRAGEVLIEAAEGADLLVVGHRGRGSVASRLLGSVGLHCVLHASCPITVVRTPAQIEPPRPAAYEVSAVR
jgi:nucleotide-binding universal stress UspA family protein